MSRKAKAKIKNTKAKPTRLTLKETASSIASNKYLYFMIAPCLVFYIVFSYFPMYGILLAFKDFYPNLGITGSPWVGWDNFNYLFQQKQFWLVLRNTVFISLGRIVLSSIAPVLIALLINELSIRFRKYKRVVQTIYTFPKFLSWVIIAGIVRELFANRGAVNGILNVFGAEPVNFLSKGTFFIPLLFLSEIWKEAGWASIGFEPITAVSGCEALDYINKHLLDVDLVITDINMPNMNGLELIKKIKSIRPDMEFIILSGYSDFEYAREGLRLGVNDYILKPVNASELESLLIKSYEKLVAFEDVPLSFSLPKGKTYFALLGNRETLNDFVEYTVYEYGRETAYIIAVEKEADRAVILDKIPAGTLVGVSSFSTQQDEHIALIKEARMAFLSKFIYGEDKVYIYRNSNFEQAKQLTRSLINTYSQNYSNIFAILEEMPQKVIEANLTIGDVVHIWNGIAGFFIIKESLSSGFNYFGADELVDEFKSQYEMFDYIAEASKDTPEIFDEEKLGVSFSNMLIYIANHYNMELYLKDLSTKFHLNLTYCCDLFKKHLNMTFHEYLTQIRMKKARELLLSGGYTITQIAGMVGYIDNYYFSRVFKKYFGVAPKIFRDENTTT